MISYSQFGQDKWVLEYFNTGIFIDVGFADGIGLSNTKLLEDIGWSGLGIDPFPQNYQTRTKTKIEIGCVYSKPIEIEFVCAGGLGGIKDHINTHKSILNHKTVKIQAKPLEFFLHSNNIPSKIEYLSIDTEGSEYEILSSFPFEKYLFGCITCEHNNEIEKRYKIQDLLFAQGYSLDKSIGVDDCFVHKSVKDSNFYNYDPKG